MSSLKHISPQEAADLMQDGAILIDIREDHERQLEHIPGTHHHALTRINPDNPIRPGDEVLIFHCHSGARTRNYAAHLAAAAGDSEVYVLDGGIVAWKQAGLPVKI